MSAHPKRPLYWARDLVAAETEVPEGFSKSLTAHGLISHGRNRYPLEWSVIHPDLLVQYLADEHPRDFDEVDLLKGVLDYVADRAHARTR